MPKSNTLILCGCLTVSLLASLVFWGQNRDMCHALESAVPPPSVEVVAVLQPAGKEDKAGVAPDISVPKAERETVSPETVESGPEQQRRAAMAGRYEVFPETLRELIGKTPIPDLSISQRVREILQITDKEAEAVREVLVKTAENGCRLEGEKAKLVDEKSKMMKIVDPFPEAESLQLEAEFFTALRNAIGTERTGILEDALREAVAKETGRFGRAARMYSTGLPKPDVETGELKWNIFHAFGQEITIKRTESGDMGGWEIKGGTINTDSVNQTNARKQYGHLFDFDIPPVEQERAQKTSVTPTVPSAPPGGSGGG